MEKDEEKASIFNEYFINIIKTSTSSMDIEEQDCEINEPFELKPRSMNEIEMIINSLNSNSSNGHDEISAKFLKRYGNILSEPLTRFINQCFETGEYPN